MKKINLISLMLSMILVLMSFSSCDFVSDDIINGSDQAEATIDDDAVDMNSNFEVFEIEEDDFVAYKTVSEINVEPYGDPVTDGKNNYFYFKLGRVKNVPVYSDDMATRHNGKTVTVYEWREATITSDTFTEMQENCIENSVSQQLTKSKESGATASVSAKYGGVSAGMSAYAKEGWAETTKKETIETRTNSFVKTINDSVETSQTKTVTIGKDSPAGYYRYTICADVEVYAVAICNIANKKVEFSYISVPVEKTYSEGFRYSEDNSLEDESDSKLALSEDALLAIGEDLFATGYQMLSNVEVLSKENFYVNEQNKTITGAGNFGLEHTDNADVIDFSEYSKYFSDEYVFEFNVEVYSKCQKVLGVWVDGYHEMHLYNKDPGYVSNSTEIINGEMASKYGWILEEVWEQRNGNDDFFWSVSGSDMADIMYIRYDAHGKGGDTWHRQTLYIDITIKTK